MMALKFGLANDGKAPFKSIQHAKRAQGWRHACEQDASCDPELQKNGKSLRLFAWLYPSNAESTGSAESGTLALIYDSYILRKILDSVALSKLRENSLIKSMPTLTVLHLMRQSPM